MPSALSTDKLSSILKVLSYDFDPDGTDPVDVAWVPISSFEHFMACLFHSVGTGNVDTFNIIANTQSDGSGTDVIVKSSTADPDAVGDFAFLECSRSELASLGSGLAYVSANVELADATDECVITYIRSGARWSYAGLTTNVIA